MEGEIHEERTVYLLIQSVIKYSLRTFSTITRKRSNSEKGKENERRMLSVVQLHDYNPVLNFMRYLMVYNVSYVWLPVVALKPELEAVP